MVQPPPMTSMLWQSRRWLPAVLAGLFPVLLSLGGALAEAPPAEAPKSSAAPPPAADSTAVARIVAHTHAHPDSRTAYSFDRSAYAGDIRELPIGIFDSGIGGLTVMEAILALDAFDNDTLRPGGDGRPDFEDESFIYLGDQANMPYGNYAAAGKEDFLRELILKDVTFLLGRRYYPTPSAPQPLFDKPAVKAIVIACNTATAYGLEDIRAASQAWQIPVVVVGVVEAGAQGVLEQLRSDSDPGTVAVLATVGTCSSMAYPKAIGRTMGLAGQRVPPVVQHGSVGLAEAIEANPAAAAPTIRADLGALLEQHRQRRGAGPISTVILGCTHFPLVQDQIATVLADLRQHEEEGQRPYESLIAEQIRWINPAELTAKALFRELAKAKLRKASEEPAGPAGDRLFISVPNPSWPGVQLSSAGGLAHDYKYGRESGQMTVEDTRVVPMTSELLPAASLQLIRSRLPRVSERLR